MSHGMTRGNLPNDNEPFVRIRTGGLQSAVPGVMLYRICLRHCFKPAGIASVMSEFVLIGRAIAVVEAGAETFVENATRNGISICETYTTHGEI